MYVSTALVLIAASIADEATGFTSRLGLSPMVVLSRERGSVFMAQSSPEEQMETDDEIDRLKSMAQKLRAEAAALEAERAEELAAATELVFRKFDTNQDGEISLKELKEGLEKSLKIELTDSRVEQIMKGFDVSGDGKLQRDEMVGLEQFRNKLEALARDEKLQALEAKKAAENEAKEALIAEVRLNLLNDKEPTTRDKLVSILPYLFPLMDSLQFGRFLIVENPDNPFVVILALLYALYKAVPFSGFVSFLVLNVLSSNPGINRLIRFNMQQAIFLDIALFFPGLIGAAYSLLLANSGATLPPILTELGSDIIFGSLLITIAYCSISSLLGETPNKIPLISQAAEDRMPTIDMFDDSGRFVPRDMREDDEEKKD
ncbi:unnamed protein product [Cylindrotheca closterium]|uniref:EF-hand domain-containing protein n=1 Tax=Cylindrotheca closterium TaxID=2856 RepID=A0AAD2CK60_9STRA|nr:unnamed protein product [Cylindrotheca closterium]